VTWMEFENMEDAFAAMASAPRMTTTTQTTLTIGGRPYTLKTDEPELFDGMAITAIGSLYNSRGDFAGQVVRYNVSGRLSIFHGPRVSIAEERRALRPLEDAINAELGEERTLV
jgi:hypothetical protein